MGAQILFAENFKNHQAFQLIAGQSSNIIMVSAKVCPRKNQPVIFYSFKEKTYKNFSAD